ncbi:MAG: glycosyltransferase family 2 protein [Actinobacteria bacterium]|nr:glycosyltransferase family 2 protein [Actinomycetota bacterium]
MADATVSGPPGVCLLLPAWNEAEGLEHALDDARASLDALVGAGVIGRYEVVVIDDGSTDDTAAIATAAAEADPRFRLVAHERNRGVGAGLRTGLEAASLEYVVSTDSDMPVDLAEIGPALDLLVRGGVDVVAGRRIERHGDGLVRWICTEGYDLVVSAAIGVRVDDVNFAFKVARTDLLRSLDLRSDGAFIDAELIASALLMGHEVEVLPMTYRPRQFGQSSTLTPRTLARLGREFVHHVPRLRRLRRDRRSTPDGAAQRNG